MDPKRCGTCSQPDYWFSIGSDYDCRVCDDYEPDIGDGVNERETGNEC